MSQAYTPGLLVTPQIVHRVRRVLPIAGDVLVTQGATVAARDVVARANLPGDVVPINLAKLLAIPPGDVPSCMLKQPGERVEVGEVIARTKGIFGFFKSEYVSRSAGTIESISSITGQMLIRGEPLPVDVQAYLAGRVVEVLPNEGCVIEAAVTFVQGIFGIGGEAFGPIRMVCDHHETPLTPELITEEMRGSIIIGGGRVSGDAVRQGIACGVAAIVSGGIDDADLKEILGYDLGVAITGTEQVGTTLIVTEGFGDIAMAQRTFELFQSCAGREASANGATQIRAGVMRPEVLIPVSSAEAATTSKSGSDSSGTTGEANAPDGKAAGGGMLEVGCFVRIIRDPYFGTIGKVTQLPSQPGLLASGSKARVLEVQPPTGPAVLVPRANVEIVTN
ncbi:MAG: hypothetical protein R3C01_01670 [Planctomycetaceae bacterium]